MYCLLGQSAKMVKQPATTPSTSSSHVAFVILLALLVSFISAAMALRTIFESGAGNSVVKSSRNIFQEEHSEEHDRL